jgi:hypothetical protein
MGKPRREGKLTSHAFRTKRDSGGLFEGLVEFGCQWVTVGKKALCAAEAMGHESFFLTVCEGKIH